MHISRLSVFRLHVRVTPTVCMVTILSMTMICTGLWVTDNDSLVSLNSLKLKITFVLVSNHSNIIIDNSIILLLQRKLNICSLWLKEKKKIIYWVIFFGRMAKDPRFDRLPCLHRGTYADDCIVNRIQQVMCFYLSTYHWFLSK